MKKYIIRTLTVIFAAVFIFSAVMLTNYYVTGNKEEQVFEELSEQIKTPVSDTEQAQSNSGRQPKKPLEDIDIAKLSAINSDSIGWMNLPGTVINYPVMHTPEDCEKYLHRDFYKKDSRSGVPFLDGAQTLDSDNMFIYGHNMKNGTMFWALRKYRNASFLSKNNKICLKTQDGTAVYSICAVIDTTDKSEWYNYRGEITEADFNKMTQYIDKNARQKTDAKVVFGDKLLTLSTCGSKDEDRLLIIAVKTEQI